MNKIARIHVNQHVIKANAKNGENNPIFTIKQGGKNTYAFNVKVKGEMELVYSPDKPLSCGAKVWIETRGEIILSQMPNVDTKQMPNVDTKEEPLMTIKGETWVKKICSGGHFEMEFLRKKERQIRNKNKLSA
tara:strand:+ start:188 stop:586 length:399 start_codon:yes stop_codon:yes gene_type:complete